MQARILTEEEIFSQIVGAALLYLHEPTSNNTRIQCNGICVVIKLQYFKKSVYYHNSMLNPKIPKLFAAFSFRNVATSIALALFFGSAIKHISYITLRSKS